MDVPLWLAAGRDERRLVFFQAEDGIRDVAVTGVQTCALPISNVTEGLKQTGRQASSGIRSRFLTHTLVVAQISLTFVLMVGAGLFVRSLLTLQTEIGRASCRERV